MTTERKPQTFHDLKNHVWTIRLNFANIAKIRDTTGIDFGKPVEFGRTWAELLNDEEKTLAVLWVVVSSQAESQSITQSDWLSEVDGNVVELAMLALSEAVVNFTQPHKRGMIEDALQVIQENWNRAVEESRTKIRGVMEAGASRAMQRLGLGQSSAKESLVTSTKNGHSAKRSRR